MTMCQTEPLDVSEYDGVEAAVLDSLAELSALPVLSVGEADFGVTELVDSGRLVEVIQG